MLSCSQARHPHLQNNKNKNHLEINLYDKQIRLRGGGDMCLDSVMCCVQSFPVMFFLVLDVLWAQGFLKVYKVVSFHTFSDRQGSWERERQRISFHSLTFVFWAHNLTSTQGHHVEQRILGITVTGWVDPEWEEYYSGGQMVWISVLALSFDLG